MYRFQKERREGYSPSCDEVQPHLLKGLWGRKRPPGLSTRPSGKWEKCSCLIRFALYLERQILAKESISLKKKKKKRANLLEPLKKGISDTRILQKTLRVWWCACGRLCLWLHGSFPLAVSTPCLAQGLHSCVRVSSMSVLSLSRSKYMHPCLHWQLCPYLELQPCLQLCPCLSTEISGSNLDPPPCEFPKAV